MKRMYRLGCSIILLATVFALPGSTFGFELIDKANPLSVYCSVKEQSVVHTAVHLFLSDLEAVSESTPTLSASLKDAGLWVGTVGQEPAFDESLSDWEISSQDVAGKWEAFKIAVVEKRGKQVLVVLGSDSRGTAYGVLELSRLIGVSPWYWWADSPIEKRSSCALHAGYTDVQSPSVQYRGFFINDEDWGLVPWSHKNFEPQNQATLGPKTYEKVFELLLRLRANTLWPAMHSCSTPFYFIEGAREMADKYGIVIGTSHCEPLMCNTNGEWDKTNKEGYNYMTNKEGVQSFWVERLKETAHSENIYTLGMRGIHDGKMQGVETLEEHTRVLSEVITDQRNLLSWHLNKDVTATPQVFMPYKEVLDVYNNGLKLPEDVTTVWCDDNYGYITRLSNEDEQKRCGGAGIYYHISYFGKPHDYLWLYSTHPALIYTEMKRAWDYGVRKLWILNVGDIKPGEYGTEFFLDMAWDIDAVLPAAISDHTEQWFKREFGKELGKPLADVFDEYFHLACIRKPEFMGWSRVQEYKKAKRSGGMTEIQDSELNPFMFGDELQKRINRYEALGCSVASIAKRIPLSYKDAYFELVQYPVLAASAMNRKQLYAQKARLYARYKYPVANEYARRSREAYQEIITLTETYNKEIRGGKWEGMIDMQPRKLPVFETPTLPDEVVTDKTFPADVWVDGIAAPLLHGKVTALPVWVMGRDSELLLSLFSKGNENIYWKLTKQPGWLEVKEKEGNLPYEKSLIVKVNDARAARLKNSKQKFAVLVGGRNYEFEMSLVQEPRGVKTEMQKMIAWNASDCSGRLEGQVIDGLGHSASAVLLPKDKMLTYEVYSTSSGNAVLRVGLVPGHAINGGELRLSVSVDDTPFQILSYDAVAGTEAWKDNVLRGQVLTKLPFKIGTPGKHIIRIKALDDNVAVDQLMLDFDPDRLFYEFPVNLY